MKPITPASLAVLRRAIPIIPCWARLPDLWPTGSLRHWGDPVAAATAALNAELFRHQIGDRQRGGEAGALDAEELHQSLNPVQRRSVDAEIGKAAGRAAELRADTSISGRQCLIRQIRPVMAD